MQNIDRNIVKHRLFYLPRSIALANIKKDFKYVHCFSENAFPYTLGKLEFKSAMLVGNFIASNMGY